MKPKLGVKLAALVICLSVASAEAAPRVGKPSLAPTITTPEAADKTIVIKSTTKSVNVFENEVVLFMVGDKNFAVKFDGNSYFYDLTTIAPAGLLDHKVKVYVGPNPSDAWLEKP